MGLPAGVVGVADLRRRPGTRRHVSLELEAEPVTVAGTSVEGAETLRLDAVLESLSDGVVAVGTVEGRWEGVCRRCLRDVAGEFRAEFREVFADEATDGETFELRSDRVDLRPLVREVVALELPLAPLCAAGCPGLCPRCGAELADGPCGCEPDSPDPRWAALEQLRFE